LCLYVQREFVSICGKRVCVYMWKERKEGRIVAGETYIVAHSLSLSYIVCYSMHVV
jgi:hypothetical protein